MTMRNLNRIIAVRVDSKLQSLLNKVSNARGEDVSDFVRRAILKELANLSFLDQEQKKALGLTAGFKGDRKKGDTLVEIEA